MVEATDANPWDEPAAGWDDEPAARAYADAAYASLIEVLDTRGIDPSGALVCDFGCGTGLLTELLVESVAAIDAVDTSTGMLGVLRRKIADRSWTNVTASVEPVKSAGPYDLVVCSSVCSFLDDYPGTVQHLGSLLAPGGVFIQWDWERPDGSDEPHALSRREMEAAIASAGLVEVQVMTAFELAIDGHLMAPLKGLGQRPTP